MIDNNADNVIKLTVELWNTFLLIDNLHPCDRNEFCHHLHCIQNMIYAHKYKIEVPNNDMLK
jgi:hypothetical protein